MQQLTLRIPEDLAADLKRAAEASSRSVNAYATLVLESALNPDLAGSEAERIRERLHKAGLLAEQLPAPRGRPDPRLVREARRQAGEGKPLADYLSERRG